MLEEQKGETEVEGHVNTPLVPEGAFDSKIDKRKYHPVVEGPVAWGQPAHGRIASSLVVAVGLECCVGQPRLEGVVGEERGGKQREMKEL